MKAVGILGLVLGLGMGWAQAEKGDWKSMLEKKVYEKDGKKLPYRQAVLGEGEKRPLVLFLHGAGERGDNNEAQLVHGAKDLAGHEANRRRYNVY